MFLGWYDPDKKYAVRQKLEDALARYQDKFSEPAKACLTSVEDAAALAADPRTPDLPIRGVDYIPRHTFYVGIEDPLTLAFPLDAEAA